MAFPIMQRNLQQVSLSNVSEAYILARTLTIRQCCELLQALDYGKFTYMPREKKFPREYYTIESTLRSSLREFHAKRVHVDFWGGPIGGPSERFIGATFAAMTADKILRSKQTMGGKKVSRTIKNILGLMKNYC